MPRAAAALLVLTGLVCLTLLVLLVVPLPAGDWLLAPLAVALPLLLMMVGAARRSGAAMTLVGLTVVWLGLEATIVGLLLLRGEPLAGPALFGLPLPAALLLFGLGVLPLPAVGLLFAHWFGGAADDAGQQPGESPR